MNSMIGKKSRAGEEDDSEASDVIHSHGSIDGKRCPQFGTAISDLKKVVPGPCTMNINSRYTVCPHVSTGH